MNLTKTVMKRPNTSMSFHAKHVLENRNDKRVGNGWTSSMSPTFSREACTKPLHEGGDLHHIFGVPADFMRLPSLEQSTMTLSSTSSSSDHSTLSSVDRMHASFNSIGLPSEYPLHRKSTSFSSTTLDEELEDFEVFDDDRVEKSSKLDCSFSSMSERNDVPPSLTSQTPPPNKAGSKRVHRRRAEMVSVDGLVKASTASRHHRRTRNCALGAKDFHESVLTELFEDVSLNEFSY